MKYPKLREETLVHIEEAADRHDEDPECTPLWEDDLIQFARMIDELDAAGVFTKKVEKALSESMDLSITEVRKVITRARQAFKYSKDLVK